MTTIDEARRERDRRAALARRDRDELWMTPAERAAEQDYRRVRAAAERMATRSEADERRRRLLELHRGQGLPLAVAFDRAGFGMRYGVAVDNRIEVR